MGGWTIGDMLVVTAGPSAPRLHATTYRWIPLPTPAGRFFRRAFTYVTFADKRRTAFQHYTALHAAAASRHVQHNMLPLTFTQTPPGTPYLLTQHSVDDDIRTTV